MTTFCNIMLFFVCLMVLSATFSTIVQLHRGGKFYWWRKSENPEKTNDLSQVTENFIT